NDYETPLEYTSEYGICENLAREDSTVCSLPFSTSRSKIRRAPMNQTNAPEEKAQHTASHGFPATRLRGRWLLLARIALAALVGFSLVVFVVSLPVYISQLQSVCYDAVCASGQLTPQTLGALRNLGLSIGFYASISIALTII